LLEILICKLDIKSR